MKNILYLLLFTCCFCYAQTYKGIVSVNPINGIGDDTVLSKKIKEPMYYSYIYSNNISRQELISKGETIIDTVSSYYDEIEKEIKPITISSIRPFKSIYYKNYNTNVGRLESARKNKNMVTEYLSIGDEIPNYKWSIAKDTLKVAGYLCKKATTTRTIMSLKQNITAWFYNDIAISDGPMFFNGLPGLILKIEIDNSTIIKFEELTQLKESSKIEAPKNTSPLITFKEHRIKKEALKQY